MPRQTSLVQTRFGQRIRFHGLLIAPGGSPIARGRVIVQEIVPGWFNGVVAILSSNARGVFVYRAPPGPSRGLIFRFAGAPGIAGATTAAIVGVRGRAVVHMPSAVRVGQRVRIWGQVVGGWVPASGVTVQLEYRVLRFGDRWTRFGHRFRCNRSGRWAASPGRWLAASGGYTYQVRAVIHGESGWPFESTASAPVTRYVVP